MPSPYNLRRREGRVKPVNYSETDSQDSDDEAEEKRVQSPLSRSHNTSGRSQSSSSQLDSSGFDTTSSTSFSFHSGQSPGARSPNSSGRLYPDLESLDSPVSRRRGTRLGDDSAQSSPEHSPRARFESSPSSKSPKPQGKAERKEKQPQNVFFSIMRSGRSVGGIVVLVFMLICLVYSNRKSAIIQPDEDLRDAVPDFQQFSQLVDGLKKQFPGQDTRFWRVVKSCAKHVFEPGEATYPAILLMVSERRNAVLTASIARAVSQAFDTAMLTPPAGGGEQAALNLTSIRGMEAAEQKLQLDRWLKDRLSGGSSAVVNHLEALLPPAALLLHGYCDGDNAPYKRVMLVLGLYLASPVDRESSAEAALRKMWVPELSEDKVGALLTRVANNVALVRDRPS